MTVIYLASLCKQLVVTELGPHTKGPMLTCLSSSALGAGGPCDPILDSRSQAKLHGQVSPHSP